MAILRSDPTRTTTLRRQYSAEMRRRFFKIRSAVIQAVWKLDVFGLTESEPLTFQQQRLTANQLPERQAWRFRTNKEKLELFQKWFQEQIDENLLSVDVKGNPWTAKYVDSAYRKGIIRSYQETRPEQLAESVEFYRGRRSQFLESTFAQGERLSKLQFLYTRSFEELRGISAAMSQQIGRVLAEGLANGSGARTIAREMSSIITEKTPRRALQRALTLARTEIIGAHAEGQLDAFEELGVEEIQVLAEWSTAGDDLVCPLCEPLEGAIMTIQEARGLIPRHPNCLHPDTLVSPGGKITGVSKRWYDGDMLIITTSFGDKLTCTPNHPIACDTGFIAANRLDIGDKIISNSISERKRIINGNDIYKPARIEDVSESFFNDSQVFSIPVPLSPKDFHGDGGGSKIAIIGSNRFLGNSFYSTIKKHLFKFNLIFRNIIRFLFSCFGKFTFCFPRYSSAKSGFISSPGLITSGRFIHKSPFNFFCFTLGSKSNTNRNKTIINTTPTYIKFFRKFINRHSFKIKFFYFINRQRDKKLFRFLTKLIGSRFVLADIIHVDSFQYSGYVYNLETTELYYIANNLSSHNCRCAWIPADVGERSRKQLSAARRRTSGKVKESLKAELPKKTRAGEAVPQTVKEAKRRSTWPGSEKEL
jgi:hypothetical protein